VNSAPVEGIIRFRLSDFAEEFSLCQGINTVIAEHVMPLRSELGEFAVDASEISQLDLDRVGRVYDVAEFDDKIDALPGKELPRPRDLFEGIAVVPGAARVLVGIVQVGEQTDTHERFGRGEERRDREHPRAREPESALMKKGSAGERKGSGERRRHDPSLPVPSETVKSE